MLRHPDFQSVHASWICFLLGWLPASLLRCFLVGHWCIASGWDHPAANCVHMILAYWHPASLPLTGWLSSIDQHMAHVHQGRDASSHFPLNYTPPKLTNCYLTTLLLDSRYFEMVKISQAVIIKILPILLDKSLTVWKTGGGNIARYSICVLPGSES